MNRDQQRQPRWYPVSQLPMVAGLIARGLEVAEEQRGLFRQAVQQPHLLDDATVDRALKQCRDELDNLWWYEEQLGRWQQESLTAKQRGEIERLARQVGHIRELSEEIAALLEKIRQGTINRILEKSDEELGMEVFERIHRSSPEARIPLTARQKRLAEKIDGWVKGIVRRGGGDEEILLEMADYMPTFKKLMDTSSEDQMQALCANYVGFYRFASLLEDLAEGIADGAIEVPEKNDSASIPLEAWERLYESAQRLWELSPWKWMAEAPLFGVEDALSGELGFVTFTGKDAVTVYRGAQGLHGLLYARREPSPDYPERILEFPQLQLTFTRRDLLEAGDLAVLRRLARDFRPNAWPLFRSIWPGYYPWFLEADEVSFFTCVLEQAREVAARYQDEPQRLAQTGEHHYLVHVADEAGRWTDQMRRIDQPLDMPVQIMMDVPLLERVRRFSHGSLALEMDLFRAPMKLPDRGERSPCMYMLLAVEASTGLILGHELLNPMTTLEAMWS